MYRIPSALILTTIFLFSCSSNEIGNSRDVNPDTIYFDYRISGEEGKDDVMIMLQYRFGGANGTTLVLNEPAQVKLDGELISTDSSKITGAYYQLIKPISEFTGKHTIAFTGIDKRQFEEEFEFKPFWLHAEIPDTVRRKELVFEMEGLNPTDYVRIFATDTSFESPGINRLDTIKNGRITISLSDLKDLVNGPIILEFHKEDERPVKNGTKEGGVIAINYVLKREFELKD